MYILETEGARGRCLATAEYSNLLWALEGECANNLLFLRGVHMCLLTRRKHPIHDVMCGLWHTTRQNCADFEGAPHYQPVWIKATVLYLHWWLRRVCNHTFERVRGCSGSVGGVACRVVGGCLHGNRPHLCMQCHETFVEAWNGREERSHAVAVKW